MAIATLPTSPGAEARALLHHLLEHGDVVGRDTAGRTIVQLSVDDWVLEKLMTFDADGAELEDGAEAEAEPDDEEDGLPGPTARPRAAENGGAKAGPGVRLRRLTPWHAGQPSSLKCTARSCRASRWRTQDIECLIEGLRLVTPCTQRIDRLIDLLEQIRDRD